MYHSFTLLTCGKYLNYFMYHFLVLTSYVDRTHSDFVALQEHYVLALKWCTYELYAMD